MVRIDHEVIDAQVGDVDAVVFLVSLRLGGLAQSGGLLGGFHGFPLPDPDARDADLGTGVEVDLESRQGIPDHHISGETGLEDYVLLPARGLHDGGINQLVDGWIGFRKVPELHQGEVPLSGHAPEYLPEHHRLVAEALGERLAGGGLTGTGRAADGYPHAVSAPSPESSFCRYFLNLYVRMSLLTICPKGTLTIV